jgi:hypothetical protein
MSFTRTRLALAAATLSAALSACIVAPAPGYYAGPVVAAAPPPVQYEPVVGVAPGPGFFWVGGWWAWGGARYVWHPGYWQGPRAGYHWVAHGWARGPGGWRETPGHWVR